MFLSSSLYLQQFFFTLHTKFSTYVLTTRKKIFILQISNGMQWKILTHVAGHSEWKTDLFQSVQHTFLLMSTNMLGEILEPHFYFFKVYYTAFPLWKGPAVTHGTD